MKPQGDMLNWRDCALVMVARQLWPATESVDNIRVPWTDPCVRYLVAEKLEYKQTLPATFSSLQQDGFNRPQLSQRLHLERDNKVFAVLDPWTLQCNQDVGGKLTYVKKNTSETVISYYGKEITLPANSVVKAIGYYTNYIVVETSAWFLFNRAKPLHFLNAMSSSNKTTGYPVADTYVMLYGAPLKQYVLTNLAGGNALQCGKPTRASIVAVYDGLVWWQTANKAQIIPTFPSGSGLKYNIKRAVCLPEQARTALFQVDRPGNTRFLTGKNESDTFLVDLQSRTVTMLVGSGATEGKFFPGYEDDKFKLWEMDGETVKKYTDGMWEHLYGST